MSDSVRPHRRQPNRLLCPWDSPGKNAGVGCHFLLQCMKVKSQSEVAQSCRTLCDPMDCSLPGSSVHGILQARVLEWGAIAFSEMSNRHCKFITWKSEPFYLLHTLLSPNIITWYHHLHCRDSNQKLKFYFLLSSLPGIPLVSQMVKKLPAGQNNWVWSLGQEDSLGKGMVTHSSILAWRIPWTEEPGGLQSMGSQKVRHDWVTNIFTFTSLA